MSVKRLENNAQTFKKVDEMMGKEDAEKKWKEKEAGVFVGWHEK